MAAALSAQGHISLAEEIESFMARVAHEEALAGGANQEGLGGEWQGEGIRDLGFTDRP